MKVKVGFLFFLSLMFCSFRPANAQNDTINKAKKAILPANPAALKKQQQRISDSIALVQKQNKVAVKEVLFLSSLEADSLKKVEDSLARVDARKPSAEADNLIKFAKTFLGTPYRWGGTTPSGFDCSGFIYYIMGNFGFSTTRTSYGLSELGRVVKLSDARPGDLIFFKGRNVNSSAVGHVGMIAEVTDDAIMVIHASTSRGVVHENFKTSRYLIPRYIKVKRLDFGEE